jgi:hypothetical protein
MFSRASGLAVPIACVCPAAQGRASNQTKAYDETGSFGHGSSPEGKGVTQPQV